MSDTVKQGHAALFKKLLSLRPPRSPKTSEVSPRLLMNAAEISTQITLPIELYQAIAQRAQVHGQSVSSEIVTLLISSLGQDAAELAEEFADWEAASDEDWLHMGNQNAVYQNDGFLQICMVVSQGLPQKLTARMLRPYLIL
jgi:Arc-like DNA binding domain